MLFGVLVAAQAARAGLLRRGVFKREDLGFVAAAIDVLFPGTMASLAAMPFHAFVCVELAIHGGSEVSRGSEICIDFFVAGLAGIGADVESWIRRCNIGFGLIRGLGLLCGFLFVVGMSRRKHQRS